MGWVGRALAAGAVLAGATAVRMLALDVREAAQARDALEAASRGLEHDGSFGPPGGEALRIAVLGDSTAAGLGVADVDEAWPRQVAARLAARCQRPVELRCAAARGHRLRTILDLQVPRLAAWLEDGWQPDLVLVSAGGNDALGRRLPSAVRRDQRRLVAALREIGPGTEVVLVACPRIDDAPRIGRLLGIGLAVLSVTTRHAQVAQARHDGHRVLLLGRYGPSFYAADGFHASARAHAWAADRTVAALAPLQGSWRVHG